MSYASGFMVGTSIGKAVYDLFHNKKKGGSAFAGAPSMQGGKVADVPRFACVSALPGRRRYRAASLVGNAGLAEFMEKKIGIMTGISSSKSTPLRAVFWSMLQVKLRWIFWKISSAPASFPMPSKGLSMPSMTPTENGLRSQMLRRTLKRPKRRGTS